jgi:aspartate/methionine/tyrosine aminotransferase
VRFSGRTPDDLAPNRLAAAVAAARASGRAVHDLTESNPTTVGLEYPWAEIDAALGAAGAGRYHPEPRGLISARRAVAGWYAARGVAVDPEHIVLTASTSEAYGFLFKLLCDPGDAVLVPRPSYPLFDHLAAAEGVATIPYRRAAAEAALQPPSLALPPPGRGEATPSPRRGEGRGGGLRAVIAVSPNNPTGDVLSAAELADLASLCGERDLALIADEVFADYATDQVPSAAGVSACLAFALGGLSKSAGLPQLKLGWIAVAGPPALRDAALARLDVIADSYLSVATPVQLAAPRLLELAVPIRAAIAARVADNRARIAAALAGIHGARLAPAAGGWYAVVDLPARIDDDALAMALAADDGVIVQPGWFFDLPAHTLVLSCIVPPETMTAGLRALAARCGG